MSVQILPQNPFAWKFRVVVERHLFGVVFRRLRRALRPYIGRTHTDVSVVRDMCRLLGWRVRAGFQQDVLFQLEKKNSTRARRRMRQDEYLPIPHPPELSARGAGASGYPQQQGRTPTSEGRRLFEDLPGKTPSKRLRAKLIGRQGSTIALMLAVL